MRLEIRNGDVLLPDGAFVREPVLVEDGRIAGVGATASVRADAVLDAGGLLVLPGIVDLHGDAFERQLMPRPGVHFPHRLALVETDRQLVANGITTAYYGLTCSWEPGLRSADAARVFLAELSAVRPRLLCDTRLHLRHETHSFDTETAVIGWIEAGLIDLLAFNDHMDYMGSRLESPAKLAVFLDRTGLPDKDFRALYGRVRDRAASVPDSLARIAAAARRKGVPMASHDDETPAMRDFYAGLGAMVCEFPVTAEVARHALAAGSPVVLGAPNILRGGSHSDRVCATAAIRADLCTVLTSDYYYPALLTAPFRLALQDVRRLGEAWQLVSANPAAAAGLADRGRIETGRRADLILVDAADPTLPIVAATLVAGRVAFAGQRQ